MQSSLAMSCNGVALNGETASVQDGGIIDPKSRVKMGVDGGRSWRSITDMKFTGTLSCRMPCTCRAGPQTKTSLAAQPRLSVDRDFDDMSENDVSAITTCNEGVGVGRVGAVKMDATRYAAKKVAQQRMPRNLNAVAGENRRTVAVRRMTANDTAQTPPFQVISGFLRDWQRHGRIIQHSRHYDAGGCGV